MSEKKNRLVRFYYTDDGYWDSHFDRDNHSFPDIHAIIYDITTEDLKSIEDSVSSYLESSAWQDSIGDFMQLVIDVLNNSGYKYQFVDIYNIGI